MTSAYEGFPMLIKESIAYGCVPVVTALEGNKMHLKNGVNALLIDAVENKEKVISEGIARVEELVNDTGTLKRISIEGHLYPMKHFDKKEFLRSSRKLLLRQVNSTTF